MFLEQQCPPLLALSHKHAQTRGWEGDRRGLGAGWALLRQPRALQAAGRTRPDPGDTEGWRLPPSPRPRAGQRTGAWAGPSWWRCLPGVHTQRASEEGHSAPRQAGIAAAQLDEPLAQALLRVSRSLTAHRVLSAQPVCVVVTWLTLPSVDGSHRDLGSPSTDFLPAHPPRRARAETHMMKAVTPMAQMSVCGTAPWPSRSSGAGDAQVGVTGCLRWRGQGDRTGACSRHPPPPDQAWCLRPAHPWSPCSL